MYVYVCIDFNKGGMTEAAINTSKEIGFQKSKINSSR